MSKKAFLSLAVILPMCIATAIYILFREVDLVIFTLLEKIHLLPLILELRSFVNSFVHPYFWIVFSLPGSLWMLSSMNLLLMIWKFKIQKQNVFWIFSPFLFAVGLEFIQKLHWTDGTFDAVDVLMYISAALVFMSVYVILTKEGPIAHYGRSLKDRNFVSPLNIKCQDDILEKKRSTMHLKSFAYTLCLISIVYCSDKITAPLSHTNPSDTSTEVPHTASIHNLSPNYPASSTH
jgi:hypothetical protein